MDAERLAYVGDMHSSHRSVVSCGNVVIFEPARRSKPVMAAHSRTRAATPDIRREKDLGRNGRLVDVDLIFDVGSNILRHHRSRLGRARRGGADMINRCRALDKARFTFHIITLECSRDGLI